MARIRSGNIVAFDRNRSKSAFIRKNPQMSIAKIVARSGCSAALVSQVRRKLHNGKTGQIEGKMEKKDYILAHYRNMTAKELAKAADCAETYARAVLKEAGVRCKAAPRGRPYNEPETTPRKGNLSRNHNFAGPITEEGMFSMLNIEIGSLEHDIWVAGTRAGSEKALIKMFRETQEKILSLKEVVCKVA